MSGFTEAWLRDFETKRGARLARDVSVIQFTLAKPIILLNDLLRMNIKQRLRYKVRLSNEIARLTDGIVLPSPFSKAHVSVERFSVREPDHDGVVGGAKLLIDCLLVRSDVHPHGLGFCVDDSPAHMMMDIRHVRSPTLKGQATTVTIERVCELAA